MGLTSGSLVANATPRPEARGLAPVRRSDEGAPAGRVDPQAAMALAETVRGIARQAKVSRERKARQISEAVRAAVGIASKNVAAPDAVVESAIQLSAAAAGAAPEFVDTIAGAASFAPGVAKARGGAAQVRAAAFAASRAPTPEIARRADPPALPLAAGRPETPPSPSFAAEISAPVAVTAPTEDAPSAVSALSPPPVPSETARDPGLVATSADTPAPLSFLTMPSLGPGTPLVPPEPAAGSPPPSTGTDVIVMEKFGVEGSAPKNSQIAVRERASVSVEIVTSRDFSKFIATDVSDIVIRMPGFSTTSRGSFAVVRGLAERYNPIRLDGMILPSSDPERQFAELDLFPTRLVDAVVVSKVFEPRLPAASSGGAVDLRTKPLPEGRLAQVQFGLKADEGALKGEKFFTTGSAGAWDWLGLGSKDRPGAPAKGTVSANVEEIRTRFTSRSSPLASTPSTFPMGGRFAAVFEDKIEFGEDGRSLGYTLNFTYDVSATSDTGRTLTIPFFIGFPTKISEPEPGTTVIFKGKDYLETEREVRVGLLASLGFALNRNHTLSASAFQSQIGADSVTKVFNGFEGGGRNLADLQKLRQAFATGTFDPKYNYNLDSNRLLLSESLRYRERNLTDLKLSGAHEFQVGQKTKLEWVLARISSYQDEPDYWFLPYSLANVDQVASRLYATGYGTPERTASRYWRKVEERTSANRVDASSQFDLGPVTGLVVQAGAYIESTDRSFTEQSYSLSGSGGAGGKTFAALIADIPRSVTSLGFGLLNPDASAERKFSAGYLSAVVPLLTQRQWVERLELLAGFRFEDYRLSSSGRGLFGNATSNAFYQTQQVKAYLGGTLLGPNSTAAERIAAAGKRLGASDSARVFTGLIDEAKAYPALALTWSPMRRMNVRASFSETVARPSFREVGPYYSRDEVNDEVQHGNVYLETSPVRNFDVRLEYFLPRKDLVALSLFAKRIVKPIERAVVDIDSVSNSTVTWFNNPDTAALRGVEFEVAKNLGFLGQFAAPFTVGGNGTWIEAEVDRNNEPVFPGGSASRRLFDQPEWIANAYVTFELPVSGFATTLSWFAISDVLRGVAQSTWSTYVASHQRLDLTLSQHVGKRWQVRCSARNLLDPSRKFIADPEVTSEEVVLRTFKDGRSYSLSATYEF